MTDNKLTDKEIIKSLKFCEDCSANINIDIIDLITRQQAENENLKVENQSLRTAANSLKMHYEEAQAEIERLEKVLNGRDQLVNALNKCYKQAKSEAYKEFARRLKCGVPQETGVIRCSDIDNLIKEMVGRKE